MSPRHAAGNLAIVSETVVEEIITRQLAFDSVQAAFETVAGEKAEVFDVVIGTGLQSEEAFAIKSGKDSLGGTVGFKCGTYWAGNNEKGYASHGSTILLLDPETGFPAVLVNASYLNGYRTAAANAVAVATLARQGASVLGVIGAGQQAEQEIRAVAEVRALSLIKIYTRSETRAAWISRQLQDLDIEIRLTSAEDAVRESDIVTTVTPSTAALVKNDWVAAGTHLSAMGADDVGKHELDTAILARAKLFADYPRQSVVIGEFQHALKDGTIASAKDVCAMGSVTAGNADGRTTDDEITVFDSSGIAIQDLVVAEAVYQAALESEQVEIINF